MVDVAFSSGTLLTPALVIGLHQFSNHWRLPYALFLMPLGLAVAAFLPRKPFVTTVSHRAEVLPIRPVGPDVGTQIGGAGTDPGLGYLALIRIPTVACCLVAGLLTGYVEWGQYFWYVSYGTQTQHLGANAALVGMQCFVVGMVLVRCWQAFFHSDWPLGQKLWRLNLLGVLGLGVTVMLPHHGFVVLYGVSNLLFGMGVGVVFPILLALAIDAAPTQSSRLSALLMSSVTAGAQLAGLMIGALADILGVQLAYSTLLVAVLGFTAAIGVLRRPRTPRTQAATVAV